MTCLIKRALPFIITLIVGTGLWSICGSDKRSSRTVERLGTRVVSQLSVEKVELPLRDAVTTLEILDVPSTHYTPEALKNQTTGVVTLLVRFNVDGSTTVVGKLQTLPYGLTEDAERVAEQTHFTPATVDGRPVEETREMNYIYPQQACSY